MINTTKSIDFKISYASSSPKLSNRAIFPLFFRLLSPESAYNVVKLAMFREFNWKKVATLHESVPLFAEVIVYIFRLHVPKSYIKSKFENLRI